ncbi:hypothetical protein [Providencia rettgeri]|uniref:hypothetical protein n=1 Tax=Providencia rettgeri TaxID=587 RepID=UPI0032DBDAC8
MGASNFNSIIGNEKLKSILDSSISVQLNEILKLSNNKNDQENKTFIQIIIEKIYSDNKEVSDRFSQKTTGLYLIDKIKKALELNFTGSEEELSRKINNDEIFSDDTVKGFFDDLLNVKPKKMKVSSPILGVKIESNISTVNIGPFEISSGKDVSEVFFDKNLMYISIEIEQVYDIDIAILKANDAFEDFIRLVHFISWNNSGIYIKVGYPLAITTIGNIIQKDSETYIVKNENGEFESVTHKNNIFNLIAIDDVFFAKNKDFGNLWDFYGEKIKSKKYKGKIQERILNSALYLGQARRDVDIKNAVIYTCIALETIFSFDENSLFQKSISDKLADTLVFIAATDLETRKKVNSLLKRVYALRSAIVHGGDKNISNDYISIGFTLRIALSELLNNEKYNDVKIIQDLYNMVKDAQYSYQHTS